MKRTFLAFQPATKFFGRFAAMQRPWLCAARARRQRVCSLSPLLLLFLALLHVPNAFAAGVVGTGTAASCTEAALDAALAGGGVVAFDCGAEPVTITLTSEIVITVDTTIDGGGLVTLSGGNAVRVLTVSGGTNLDLRNLTVANGFIAGTGGGIRNLGTLIITNSRILENSAGFGAGISNEGVATLRDSTLTGNSHSGVGCIPVCFGGGISNSGTLRITGCTLFGNGTPQASIGGGIFNAAGSLTITNSTLANNQAEEAGGIAISAGAVALASSTLMDNGVNNISNGSEILVGHGTVTVANSIVANSTGSNCAGEIIDGGHNLQWPGTNCGETIPSLDPLLDPAGLEDNGGPTQTIALLAGSPAIDGADPEACADPPVNGADQRGYVRPGTGSTNCSIGAYEYNSAGPLVGCAGDCDGDGEVTIEELIILVNVALGTAVTTCSAGDTNGDSIVTIDEIVRTVNAALTGCSPLPWQPGPFGVGYRHMTFTKESVTVPGQQRVLDTWIWYPADAATASLDQYPKGRGGAPLAEGVGKLPLLLFSHGSCGTTTGSLFLETVLASYGFVVAAPPHPGNTLADFGCGSEAAREDAYANRPADISFVIDSLVALSDTPAAFFHDSVDAQRIGVMGHSFGADTTLMVSARDHRVLAGLALASGALVPAEEIASIEIPMMIQGGDLDTLNPYEEYAGHDFAALGPPRYLVEIIGIGHFGFSDLCVSPPDPCGEPGTLTQDEAHRLVRRYAVPFFLRWVAGDRRFDAYLAPAPGVVFTADSGNAGLRPLWRAAPRRMP